MEITRKVTITILNGSRLGKEYAANAIVDKLENPHKYEYLMNPAPLHPSTQFTTQQQPHPTQETQPIRRTEQHPESSSIGDSIGSLFDIRYCLMALTQKKSSSAAECNAKRRKGGECS